MICGSGNSGPGLVQAQQCCKVKPANGPPSVNWTIEMTQTIKILALIKND